jgi:RND family efflux transporter MFP subunit
VETDFRDGADLSPRCHTEPGRPADLRLRNRFRSGFGVVVAIFATPFLGGCQPDGPPVASVDAAEESTPQLSAATFEIREMSWPMIVRCQGTLYADEVSEVGARVAGRTGEVHVDLGDEVKAGQPLVTLETDEFELLASQAEAQLAQTRSAVGLGPDDVGDSLDPENSPPVRQERAIWNEAKASLERAMKLMEQGAISDGEFDLVASAERVAEARYSASVNAVREKLSLIGVRRVELALARQKLGDAVIRAPFDGLVQNRRVAPGSYINAGDAVLSLVRTDPIWFRGSLPERYAARLKAGLELTIQIESVDEPVVATVTRVSPSLDMSSRSLAFEAKIENPNQRYRSGVFASAEVVLDPASQSLVVPLSAITDFAGSQKVWKLVDGIARQCEISTGGRRDDLVEVVEGLTGGDTILSDASVGRVAKVISSGETNVSVESSGIGGSEASARRTRLDTLAGVNPK